MSRVTFFHVEIIASRSPRSFWILTCNFCSWEWWCLDFLCPSPDWSLELGLFLGGCSDWSRPPRLLEAARFSNSAKSAVKFLTSGIVWWAMADGGREILDARGGDRMYDDSLWVVGEVARLDSGKWVGNVRPGPEKWLNCDGWSSKK